MIEADVLEFVGALEGVAVLTASEEGGAPEAAWGDSFFYYVPPGEEPNFQQQPFATLVCSDYPGFDEESQLDRPGAFRVNVAVGKDRYEALLGHSPADFEAHRGEFDYTGADALLPHPVYAQQGWVSVVNPGADTTSLVKDLLTDARDLAAGRASRRSDIGTERAD